VNAPPTYQWTMTFKDYLGVFMKLLLNDFSMFSNLHTHLPKLELCFDKCREFKLNLNLEKCMFLVYSCIVLGYVVSKEGKLLDPKNNFETLGYWMNHVFKTKDPLNEWNVILI